MYDGAVRGYFAVFKQTVDGTFNEDNETAGLISREGSPSPPHLLPHSLQFFFPVNPSLSPALSPTPAFVPPSGSALVIPQSCSFCSPPRSPPASSVRCSVSFIHSFIDLFMSYPTSSRLPAKTTEIHFLPRRPVDCCGSTSSS